MLGDVWRVTLGARWMRWTAPLLAPLFRWNHNGVMRAGQQGLADYLAQPAPGTVASAPARR